MGTFDTEISQNYGDEIDSANEAVGARNCETQSPSERKAALRRGALCDSKVRQDCYLTHPMVCNTLQIATPPVREAYHQVVHLVIHRATGAPFIGDFRLGKTNTIAVLHGERREHDGVLRPSGL